MCGNSLEISEKLHGPLSLYASKEIKDFSLPSWKVFVLSCRACGWFSLREIANDSECSFGLDHILAGVLRVFDTSKKAALLYIMSNHLYDIGKQPLSISASKLGIVLEKAIRKDFSPCRVLHIGMNKTKFGGRNDVYLTTDSTPGPWLFQITRYATDAQIRPVWILNGVIFENGKPTHILITIEDSKEGNQNNEPIMNATPPYLVEIKNADAVIRLFAKEPKIEVKTALNHARRSMTVWKNWVPLPEVFFVESGYQQRNYYL
jgi:hypothetical protein